ncbi:MAG: DUF559 domain-containing protein [Sphingobacteriales bacterium JAD_PAG50586_3]|nr:MAG: DUF559 domain-containing protein [Sphingobacteriales bacterium JAD_PAG50586_3]
MEKTPFVEHYNTNLKSYAKQHRNEGTKAEATLWKYVLRGKQMRGYTFNRQRPVLNYIADFMCKPLKLVIEVDGVTHEDSIARDYTKTKSLEEAGFTVLRFKDDDVLKNIELVKKEIELAIERLEDNL